MNMISLQYTDLVLASVLILLLSVFSLLLKLGLTRQILIAAIRTALQLTLIGLVLKVIFETVNPWWLLLMTMFMLLTAGREIVRRQKRPFKGVWGFAMSTTAMLLSAFTITFFALMTIIRNTPWYLPQYSIPLLGMMLGNTMNGITLGMDRLTQTAWLQKGAIETRLMLGQSWSDAIADVRRDSAKGALIPILNTMSIAGLVSLPGMMTGQILAGNPPMEAVKYQIMIMFMIAGGTGFGSFTSIWLGAYRLFDKRQRLRLDRLTN